MFDLEGFVWIIAFLYIGKQILEYFVKKEHITSICLISVIIGFPIMIVYIVKEIPYDNITTLCAYFSALGMWGLQGFETIFSGYKIVPVQKEKLTSP